MKTKSSICTFFSLAGVLLILHAPRLAAQSRGNVEFTAHVAPTGGQSEPVRELTFYLLSKSLEDIRTEAAQQAPGPDLDKFIDALDVSAELKAWMKKHRSVRLSGTDFVKELTPDDIVSVREYFKAYMDHNEAYRGIGFPQPKIKVKDDKSNVEQYEAQTKEYLAAVSKYIADNPETLKGIDIELITLNPYPKWLSLTGKWRQQLDGRAFQLAQEHYLVAHTDTDLDGRGSFVGVTPGSYWIGMLGTEAVSGDVRLHWDVPVTVRPGQTSHVELSNLNAARPSIEAQKSEN